MFIALLEITIIVCLIIDISGFMDSIKWALSKWLKCEPYQVRIKPFDCSLCSTWWICLIYLVCTHQLCLLGLLYSIVLACFSSLVGDIYYTIKDTIIKILKLINKL